MSNSENDKLMAEFMDTLEESEGCSYCGNVNVCDVRGCCGEVHTSVIYADDEGQTFPADSLECEFKSWLKKREKRETA